jgi:hypothetical protein
MPQKPARYVGLYALDENDQAFHFKDPKNRSPRAIVEQVDGDRFGFPTLKDAKRFMTIHGMVAVSEIDLQKLRKAEQP